MSFGVLALIVFAGLFGPLLALGRGGAVPVVVGELAAGVVFGESGLRWLRPEQPTAVFLAGVGFAMLMFAAGMHVPLRQPGIETGLRRGAVAMLVVAVLAIPAGIAVAVLTPDGHAAIYALLLAGGSAAIVLPALEEEGLLDDQRALTVMAQVGIADVCAIIALPLVMQPSKAVHAALGGLAVGAAAAGVLVCSRLLRGHRLVHRFRHASKKHGWALDLRLSLLVLFSLAWLAEKTGTSILIAGFAVGLLVALIGGPKRLSKQVTGIAAGFLVPLFFVQLGARLDLRALIQHPRNLELAVLLLAANLAVHLLGALTTRQPPAAGLAATAQLGLPAAAATIGLQQHILTPAQAAAIVLAALGSIALTAFGIDHLGKRARESTAANSTPPGPAP